MSAKEINQHMSDKANIVLVHGAWADGSCWSAVIQSLQANGYTVTAPQFPETSLADDVARLRQGRDGGASMEVTPSWYLVATDDKAILPDAERMFAKRMGAHTVEVSSSHMAIVSHSAEVAQLIEAVAEVVRSSSGESVAVA
jgi:pimeloyl-ACP methyl ester carboxylesterase